MNNRNSFSIDNFINNRELNIMKAVLPLLPPSTQRFLAMYIAMKELSNIFGLLGALGKGSFYTENNNDDNIDFSKIFEAVKGFLKPSELETIENYYNMMNMMKMFGEMSAMFEDTADNSDDSDNNDHNSGNNSSGFNMDMLKAMLTPEQSAIFDSFSNMN